MARLTRTLLGWQLGVILAAGPSLAVAQTIPPPVLDRDLFFGNPEISGAQLSPDGQFIAFIKPYKDTRNIWVKRLAEPYTAARLLTTDTKRPISNYFWSRDSKYVLFAQDKAGDENFNVYAVDPAAAPAPGADAPAARNLTDAKGARALLYSVPKTSPDAIFVGLNDRDPAWHDLYQVAISTGQRTLLRKNTERISGWVFDEAGKLRLATRTADNGDTDILRVDEAGFTKVYSCSVFESCGPVRFHKEATRVYMVTNKGDVDLMRLTLFDPASGKEELVESDPMKKVDFGNAVFSEVSDELVATSYEDERTRRYFRDKVFEADYRAIEKKLPGRELAVPSVTKDEQLWLVSASSDTEPGERYLYDRKSKQLTLQYRAFEKLPRAALASMTAISYLSADGLQIPAFLTLPKGVPAKNLPMILLPHGGPWARDTFGYRAQVQFLANRGYAVLQPNFRGSTGYGKKFLNAGNNQWGDKMQDDLTAGVKYLVAQGAVDARRVGIMGGSYGGYATLAGVAFTPDLYAGAVAIVAPSNLITLLDSIPPYWEAGRKIFYERMGNPTTPEGKAQLQRQSPLNSSAKIRTPLLVVQGANDPRVKKAESDQIVIALRDRGFAVEYLVAPDEGHGFARPVNNMALFAAAEKFLAKHLGGRFQESMTPDVTTRLGEIRVDPKTVVLAPKVDTNAATTAPKPVAALTAGTKRYAVTIAVNGQTISLAASSVVVDKGDTVVVTDTMTTPQGDVTDTVTLDKATLTVRSRAVKQGPVAIDLAFADGKASGTMAMGGQAKPVAVDVGGPIFADGAGSYDVLATLALAEGFTTTFRNFDVQKQKASLKQLKVTGVEEVTVAAGSFKTLKVDITSAEGEPGSTTVWIAPDTRQVVKMSAIVPAMGGAMMTSELQK
jgi:dipeptidyl aminopeptidase/acylaminoacyl peptidase